MTDYYATNAYSRTNAGSGNIGDNSDTTNKYYSNNSNSNSSNDFYSNPYGQGQQQQQQGQQQQPQQQQAQQPSIFSNLANAASMANNNNQNNNNNNAAPSFWNPVATQLATAAMNSVANSNGGTGTGAGAGANIDPISQIAINETSTFIKSNMAKFIPGLETFMNTFRRYFAVDNGYVKRKMVRVLFSFFCKNWSRKKNEAPIAAAPTQSTGGPASSFTVSKVTYAVPRDDDNAPDLYIPFMSLITYVLISALCYGTAGHFDPEVIVDVTTKCVLTQVVEVCLFKFGVYMISSGASNAGGDNGVSFWDLFAFTGYKYLALTCNLIIGFSVSMIGSGSGSDTATTGVVTDGTGDEDDEGAPVIENTSNMANTVDSGGYGQKGYYIMFLWTASSICYFMFKTMANNLPQKNQQQQQQYYPQTAQYPQKNGPTREIVILVFALSQFVTLWYLGQTKFLN